MLAQTASLYLQGIPDPATGRRSVDLAASREIIDSLVALREKTRGRLSFEETDSLEGLLGELQLVFTRLAAQAKGGARNASSAEAERLTLREPMRRTTGLGLPRRAARRAALALLLLPLLGGAPAGAQVLQAPGEATETTFRREVRGAVVRVARGPRGGRPRSWRRRRSRRSSGTRGRSA